MHNGTDLESEALDQAIACRAYQLWEDEGRPEGRDQEHWTSAEDEILFARSAPMRKPELHANPTRSSPRTTGTRRRKQIPIPD